MESIRKVSEIIDTCQEIVEVARRQDYYDLMTLQRKLVALISDSLDSFSQDEAEGLTFILSDVVNAFENKDYVLYADLLEISFIPYIYNKIASMIASVTIEYNEAIYNKNMAALKQQNGDLYNKVAGIKSELAPEYTSSGHLTLCVSQGSKSLYLHSNANPVTEARVFANEYYSVDCDRYVIFGLGLAYHIKAFLKKDDGISIDIIEPRMDVFLTAVKYVDFEGLFENNRIRFFVGNECNDIAEVIKNAEVIAIHHPSLLLASETEIGKMFEKFFIRESGMRRHESIFKNNLRDNVKNADAYVDELRSQFESKNVIIVAGGPSLDKNIELLRTVPENTIILAVATVFRKLVDINIRPDYLVLLDAQVHTQRYFDGLYDMDVPLIVACTAVKDVAANYKGKKYLVCQRGYDKAELIAKEKEYNLYESGGSVTTIAFDIAVRLGANNVAFVGLDLAYTGNKSHTSNAFFGRDINEDDDCIEVKSVEGGMVRSSRVFEIYRKWIEKRANQDDIKGRAIDATEGGALIEGLKTMKLKDALELFSK